jgi:bisphosphoglycerate-dependent phosphoglycerate mutase
MCTASFFFFFSGTEEAKQAEMVLNSENLKFDVAYTSVLQRACDSLNIILREIK